MCEIDKLVNELSSHYPEIKSNIETKISIIAIQLGKKKFDELFLGNHQETQDCTKLFQFVVNSAIEDYGSLHAVVNNAGILRDKSFAILISYI